MLVQKRDVNKSISYLYEKGTVNAVNILLMIKLHLAKKEMSTKASLIYTKKAPSMQSTFYL
jgi:hypothetical protein